MACRACDQAGVRYVVGAGLVGTAGVPSARPAALAAPTIDRGSPFVRWFEEKQQAAWCELYPHLLKLLSAGQRAKSLEGRFQQYATSLPFSLVPQAQSLLLSRAAEAADLASKARRGADLIYAVKDYTLGANFGAEGWKYESWCRQNGHQLKSAEQIAREAEAAGLGGLGVAPIIVGAVTVGGVLAFIAWVVMRVAELNRDAESLATDQQLCSRGDQQACARAMASIQGREDARRKAADNRDPLTNISSIVQWGIIGALGFMAFKFFSKPRASAAQQQPSG